MGGATVLAAHPIQPVGSGPYYDVYSDVFIATNTALELDFAKTDPTGGDSTALIDSVTVLPIPPGTPPRLLNQPLSVTNALVGDTVTFTARGLGTIPLSYQWMKDGVPLTGQTNATLTLANVVQTNSGAYVQTVSNSSGSTNSLAAQLAVTARVLAGAAYGTGVANDGTLLAAGSADPHYMLTVSPDPNAPAGTNAIVVNFAWPIAAGVWVLNGPNSEWIAPSAAQGTGNAKGNYVYETTVNLTGQDLNQVQIVGSWAADNSGTNIKVNGASTGLTCPSFTPLTPFTLVKANGLVAGTNTLDFLVNNLPATPNPTGLRVDLKALVLLQSVSTAATLKVSRSGANLVISWSPTSQGQKLLSAHDLKGPWTEITGASNPYTANIGVTNTYFRVSQ